MYYSIFIGRVKLKIINPNKYGVSTANRYQFQTAELTTTHSTFQK